MNPLAGLAVIGISALVGRSSRKPVSAEYVRYQESHDDGQATNYRVIVRYDDGTTRDIPVIRSGAARFLVKHYRDRIRTGVRKPLPHGWWNR